MLDETALRKPEFSPGTPVKLADGQAWIAPKVCQRFTLDASGDLEVVVALAANDDRSLETAFRRLKSATAGGAIIAAELGLAATLLRANYDLTTDDLTTLVAFSYDPASGDSYRIRNELMALATGRGLDEPETPAAAA